MGSDKTVIRAGYGIFHDSSWNQGGQGLWQNPPYYAEVDPCPSDFCLGYNSAFGSLSGGFLVDPTTPSSTPVTGGAVLSGPVNPASLHRNHPVNESQFPAGHGSAVQPEHGAPVARKCRFDRRLCWYPQHAYSRRPVEREFESRRSACGVVAGYTVGCGFPSYPYAAPFQAVVANNSWERPATTLSRLKAKPRAHDTGSTRCWAIPGPAPLIPVCPMVWERIRARFTTLCPVSRSWIGVCRS